MNASTFPVARRWLRYTARIFGPKASPCITPTTPAAPWAMTRRRVLGDLSGDVSKKF